MFVNATMKSFTKPKVNTGEATTPVSMYSIANSHKAGELIAQLLVLLIGSVIGPIN